MGYNNASVRKKRITLWAYGLMGFLMCKWAVSVQHWNVTAYRPQHTPLMVALTLVNEAAAKGAGISLSLCSLTTPFWNFSLSLHLAATSTTTSIPFDWNIYAATYCGYYNNSSFCHNNLILRI